MHVIESPCIRLQLSYRMCLTTCILAIPGIPPQLLLVIPKTIGRCRTSPRGVFPLGLGWQTILCPAFLVIAAAAGTPGHPPRKHFPRAEWIALKPTGIVAHNSLPLALRDFILAHIERLADAHRMNGTLVTQHQSSTPSETPLPESGRTPCPRLFVKSSGVAGAGTCRLPVPEE